VKVKLYGEVEKILPPGAILASNTSTISITRMAKSVAKPESFAGCTSSIRLTECSWSK